MTVEHRHRATEPLTTDALPLPVVLAGGASVVMGTAAILSSRAMTRPVLPASRWHRPLPPTVRTRVDRPFTRAALGVVGLLMVGAAMAALATSDARVHAGTAVGGITIVAALLGPPVRWLNPVRLASSTAAGGRGTTPTSTQAIGWPAVAWLGGVAAVVVAVDDGRVLVAVLAVVLVGQVALARRYGPRWHVHGDPYDAVVTFVAQMAPLGRDADGRLGWRNPIVNAAHTVAPPAVLGMTAILVGLALTEVGVADPIAHPATMLLVFAVTTAAAGATLWVGIIRPYMRGALAPMVTAYGVLLAGAPPLWPLALVAFVGLHAVAVAVLHRQAIARHDPRTARAVQFPARSVVVVSVLAGLWTCLGT